MDSIPQRLFSSESEQKRLMSQPELSSSTLNLIVNNNFRRSSKYSSLSYSRQRRRLVVTTGSSRNSRNSGGSVSRHCSHSADKLNYCIRNTETMRLSTTESLPPPLPVIMSNCPSDLSAAAARAHDENENATIASYEKDGDLMGTMRKRDRGSQLTFPSSSQSSSSSSSRPASRSFCFHQTIMFTFLSAMLLISAGHGVEGLRINQFGGYEDVVVNIGNDVPPITCEQLVMGIQMAFKSASAYLNEATKGRAYFHRVQIILPASWTSTGCGKVLTDSHTSASTVQESHFHIDGGHPIFGHRPWTKQFQGCGKQGDKIHLGYQYIVGYNGTNRVQEHEYPERMFVHEWAKFRYGVFEEIGFENDPIYPTNYYGDDNGGYHGYSRGSSSSATERRPTSCTNKPLQGSWTGDCDKRSGSPHQQNTEPQQQQHQNHLGFEYPSSSGESNDRSGANCVFEPLLSDNRNITSSIMSHPHLRNVKSFCDHSTHNRYAPTKHNFLCDRKSISEVIYSHPDFHNLSSHSLARHGRNITPEFYVKQLTKPRFVLMVEESGNMNLRDVWKFLKLAIRKFIKYDLPIGTEIGIMTVSSSDIRIMANVTTLTDSGRGNIAEKLPNYPSIDTGSLSLRKGISTAIKMLKSNDRPVAGSVIILISQGSISSMDMETVVHQLRQEQVSVATIEYPSIGDGKISSLSRATRSPHYMIRETGVGPQSHISTYIQLVNSLMDIQRFFTRGIARKWPTLVHQQEFKGDAPGLVNGTFSISNSQAPSEFYVYIANPIDPKVNRVELTSPTGVKYSDQLSLLHDINVIKIDAIIDQPGIWRYSMERLGDSHQSHFVQVLTTTSSSSSDEFSVRVFSNAEESRVVNLTQSPLILYTEVKRGISPVIDADVEASITAGTTKWTLKLLDNGNSDSDITKGDGIYSSYVVPPMTMQSALLEIIIKVETSPYRTKYVGMDSLNGMASSSTSSPTYPSHGKRKKDEPCCGSRMIPDWMRLKPMSYNERVMDAYTVKISNAKSSNYYAPSRIGDLRIVKQYDLELTLSFTAPGEDFDQGSVRSYQVFYRRSLDSKPMPREPYESDGSPAGSEVNLTITLPGHDLFYLYVVATDHYKNQGKPSNTLQVLAEPPPPEPNSGRTQKQTDMETREGEDNGKLRPWQIALIVGGVVAFVVVAAVVFLVCFFCRRRGTGGLGSTETKISTITNNKEPIHWSASQLLNEHEKRQSIYGQSSNGTSQQGSFDPETQNGSVGEQHQNQQQQHPHHHHHQFNGSPGSSTRSFRSISENARKTSVDYESCSSDPTMRSMKGPTDYETPIESDPENYRTIDSYTRVHYRINGGPPPTYAPRMNGNAVQYPPQYHQNIPVNSYGTQLQYSGNIQGSLSSVASKQRNITMV